MVENGRPIKESAENEGADWLLHNLDSDVTFQLPEPAQVVET